VLGGVDGRLGPSGERPGVWSLHVAIASQREVFMMFEQDDLSLAVPWSAVARVRLVPVAAIETMAGRQGLTVLPSLARDARPAPEQPVMIVGHGLKRACLVADRLVWRMEAEPVAAPGASPAPGIERAVRTEDGTVHWVLEPAWLLRDVAPPPLPETPRRVTPPAARPASAPAPAAAEKTATPARTTPPAPIPFRRPLRELTPADVTPIDETGRAPVSTPASTAGERQALVVEDSITARVFLTRLLEQKGYVVHAVSTAREMRELLPLGPWRLVCADVELPDARGADLMRDVRRALGDASALIALVRDAADESVARSAGIAATLRKPFERESLERALERAGAGGPAAAR
jgi:CheY-like chemotaxis protein